MNVSFKHYTLFEVLIFTRVQDNANIKQLLYVLKFILNIQACPSLFILQTFPLLFLFHFHCLLSDKLIIKTHYDYE